MKNRMKLIVPIISLITMAPFGLLFLTSCSSAAATPNTNNVNIDFAGTKYRIYNNNIQKEVKDADGKITWTSPPNKIEIDKEKPGYAENVVRTQFEIITLFSSFIKSLYVSSAEYLSATPAILAKDKKIVITNPADPENSNLINNQLAREFSVAFSKPLGTAKNVARLGLTSINIGSSTGISDADFNTGIGSTMGGYFFNYGIEVPEGNLIDNPKSTLEKPLDKISKPIEVTLSGLEANFTYWKTNGGTSTIPLTLTEIEKIDPINWSNYGVKPTCDNFTIPLADFNFSIAPKIYKEEVKPVEPPKVGEEVKPTYIYKSLGTMELRNKEIETKNDKGEVISTSVVPYTIFTKDDAGYLKTEKYNKILKEANGYLNGKETDYIEFIKRNQEVLKQTYDIFKIINIKTEIKPESKLNIFYKLYTTFKKEEK